MSRMKKYVGIALLVGLVAALGISSVASAQSSVTPTPTAPTTQTAPPTAPPDRDGAARTAQPGGVGGGSESAGHDDR